MLRIGFGGAEWLPSENNPEDPATGSRVIPFSRELYIERDDFMEVPAKKYFRLSPGQMVRLKSAYIIKCHEVKKDEAGNVVELHCTYVPESKSGSDVSGLVVKGVIHWVSVAEALEVEVRLYDRLFTAEDLNQVEDDFKNYLNPDSLKILQKCYAEPDLASAKSENHFQFMRIGYFCMDPDSTSKKLVFNRTVTLRDMWAKKGG